MKGEHINYHPSDSKQYLNFLFTFEDVTKFIYLSSEVSSETETEVKSRFGEVIASFRILRNIWIGASLDAVPLIMIFKSILFSVCGRPQPKLNINLTLLLANAWEKFSEYYILVVFYVEFS